jgi:hypothetical protein
LFWNLKAHLPPQNSSCCYTHEPQAPLTPFPHPEKQRGSGGGSQHYRQPAWGHGAHDLGLWSVGGGVEAGTRRHSSRHRLRVQRGVVGGGGGRAELGAAEVRRPQFRGAQSGHPLCGLRGGRSQGSGPAQHGESGAPYPVGPGAPEGTCGLWSLQRLTPPAAWRGGRGKPPMDACGARPDPPLLARGRAGQRLEITAWRSPRTGGTARVCPAPGAAKARRPGALETWAPGVWSAWGGVPSGCGNGREAMRSDGGGDPDGSDRSQIGLWSLSFSRSLFSFLPFFFFLARNCVPRNSDLPRKMERFDWLLQHVRLHPRKEPVLERQLQLELQALKGPQHLLPPSVSQR